MRWWVVAAAALLVGCAGDPIKPPLKVPTNQLRHLATIENWHADGRVAIQRGEEGWSASMRWTKRGTEFQLRLIAPLGRGTFQIAGNDQQVELIAPNGDHFYSSDAQSLMDEQLGWSIPLHGAEYWLRGLVAPSSVPLAVRRDPAGLLTDMEQAGWRISILRRAPFDGMQLPTKLYMHYGDLKVRIVVSAWNFNAT